MAKQYCIWQIGVVVSDSIKAILGLEGLTPNQKLELLQAKNTNGKTVLHWAAENGTLILLR